MMDLVNQGRRAYAYTGGKPFDAALPCVMFVHGALHDHSVWTLLARWFAHHGHGVLAVDLPGHRRSEGPALPDVAAHARWCLDLLDAAGVHRAALVGHSMGSLIALEAASMAPERVTQLVMVATAEPMEVSQALLDTARDDPLLAIDRVVQFSLSTFAAKPSFPGPGAWLHGGSRALMRRVHAGHSGGSLLHHDFTVCNDYRGALDAAARVACPSTLILGRHDQMTPPARTARLAAALKARVVTLESGHVPMAEQPDATLAALRSAIA